MPPRNNLLRRLSFALVIAFASSAASAASAAARSSLLAGRGAAPAAPSDAKPLYKQAGAPIPARVADLVGRMTVDELIAAVAHKDGGTADEIKSAYGNTSLGGVKITFAEGATALEVVRARNNLQRFFVQNSRLNIPLSFAQEGLHSGGDYGTVFPEPLLTACSWNDSLALAIGQVLGSEARASGVDNTWSPVVNMWVDDRFGRYQEGFSEYGKRSGRPVHAMFPHASNSPRNSQAPTPPSRATSGATSCSACRAARRSRPTIYRAASTSRRGRQRSTLPA